MKEIKVNIKNAERIMNIINAVQGRATERVVLAYSRIESTCQDVENRLARVIPSHGFKKALEGTEFLYDARQKFPRSYHCIASSTWFKCKYHNGNWYLIDVGRDICPNGNYYYPYELRLSESCKTAILKTFE